MTEEFKLAATKQFIHETQRWLEMIARGETLSVLFFPKTDRHIRLSHLLNQKELLKKVLVDNEKYIFLQLDFEAHDVEDIRDLYYQIEERLNLAKITSKSLTFDKWREYLQENNKKLVLIVTEGEKYLNEVGKNTLRALSELVFEYVSS